MVTISIKMVGVNFGNSILDNSKWDKVSEGIVKKYISRTEWDSLWEVQRKLKREYTISSGTGKKYELPDTKLNSPFGGVD